MIWEGKVEGKAGLAGEAQLGKQDTEEIGRDKGLDNKETQISSATRPRGYNKVQKKDTVSGEEKSCISKEASFNEWGLKR